MKVQQWLPIVLPGDSEAQWRPGGGLEEGHPEETTNSETGPGEDCRAVCVCVCVRTCSVVSNSVTLWSIAHQAPLSMGFSPGKNTGVSCHFLSRGSSQRRDLLCQCQAASL